MYTFKNITEKERIYSYWNHNESGLPICSVLYDHFGNRPFSFVEIGCQLLGLSNLLLHEFNNSEIMAIDIVDQNPIERERMLQNFPKRFTFILGSSLTTHNYFREKELDVIYIDTDPHTLDQLKEEMELWIPKVKPGGLVILHDYAHPMHPDVKICVDEYCRANNKTLYFAGYYNVFFLLK